MTDAQRFECWTGMPEGSMAGWEFAPLEVAGEVAAVAALRGVEIHFAAAPHWRGRIVTRKRARDFLGPLLSRRGYLTTRVHGERDDSFVRRMGFEPTWSAESVRHFMLTTLPFGGH